MKIWLQLFYENINVVYMCTFLCFETRSLVSHQIVYLLFATPWGRRECILVQKEMIERILQSTPKGYRTVF